MYLNSYMQVYYRDDGRLVLKVDVVMSPDLTIRAAHKLAGELWVVCCVLWFPVWGLFGDLPWGLYFATYINTLSYISRNLFKMRENIFKIMTRYKWFKNTKMVRIVLLWNANHDLSLSSRHLINFHVYVLYRI